MGIILHNNAEIEEVKRLDLVPIGKRLVQLEVFREKTKKYEYRQSTTEVYPNKVLEQRKNLVEHM